MRWFVFTATVALVLAPMAVSSQRVPSQQLVELAIGRIPAIADSSPKLWGMSGMEMIYIRQPAGSLTPAMRTEMYDARTVEILSRTQAPPLRPSDINVVARNGHEYIAVRKYILMEVLPTDAKAEQSSVNALAHKWASRVRTVLPQVAPGPSRFGI